MRVLTTKYNDIMNKKCTFISFHDARMAVDVLWHCEQYFAKYNGITILEAFTQELQEMIKQILKRKRVCSSLTKKSFCVTSRRNIF